MDLFNQMLRIRMIEEKIAKEYPKGKMRCPIHLSIGQEAAAVGVCAALDKDDKMVSTHRGHAHYLAKGGSLKGLIGELYGKRTGCSKGNGGSMHLIDLACGFYGSTSIVGGTIPYGVGLAFADHFRESKAWTVVCIGDAAVEEGVFHEAANFASLHNLRVLFVLEDNQYSCYTHKKERQPKREFKDIAQAHALNYCHAKPNDVNDILIKTKEAKASELPTLLVIPTYRYLEHCGPNNDDHLGYRPPDEIKFWKSIDPLSKKDDYDLLQTMYFADEITQAFVFAEESEDAYRMDVYAD